MSAEITLKPGGVEDGYVRLEYASLLERNMTYHYLNWLTLDSIKIGVRISTGCLYSLSSIELKTYKFGEIITKNMLKNRYYEWRVENRYYDRA